MITPHLRSSYEGEFYEDDGSLRRMALSYPTPVILSENDEEITVTVDAFDPCVILDVPCLLSENCFPLKAGEVKVLKKLERL